MAPSKPSANDDVQGSKKELPAKENALFRQVVRCYENKQYKKGLKAADAVLKKFPNHGETLCMKGLIVSYATPENKEEAYELVKHGLKYDVRSHVCWHVYGLLNRADRDYREAIKCYRMALRIDDQNAQILRDLSWLQIQVRDLDDFVETRRQLLQGKPTQKTNWISFAMANFLCGKHDVALSAIDKYETSVKKHAKPDDPLMAKYEDSELIMFKAMILEEAGKFKEALALIAAREGKIVDAIGAMDARARMLLAIGDVSGAADAYRALIDRMPDNHEYHRALHKCIIGMDDVSDVASLNADDVSKLEALYDELGVKHPRCDTIKRFPLEYSSGAAFEAKLRAFAEKPLRKGVPSLFQDIEALYANDEKAAIMGRVFEDIAETLEKTGAFPPAQGDGQEGGAEKDFEKEKEKDPSSCRVHALALLAHHKSKTGDDAGALATIDAALAIESKSKIECLLAKATFLEKAGALRDAAGVGEEARAADLADRFLNSVCVRRLLQCGEHEEAEKTVALFTRDGDQASNLYDMQCAWFENYAGRCHAAAGRRGRALKYFQAVKTHYDDMEEDQFDFHQYCLRKMTLRSYVEMLRVEDALYARAAYREAAKGGIETYVDLHDKPLADEEAAEEAMLAAMTSDARKQYRKEKRKTEEKEAKIREAKKREEERELKKAADAAAKEGKKRKPTPKKEDPDPNGEKLARTKTPLDDAAKLLEPLLRHAGAHLETHALAFEVYARKGKLLKALRAVNAALAVAPGSFKAARLVARLARLVEELPRPPAEDDATHAAVRVVLEEGVEKATGGKSAMSFAEDMVKRAASPSEAAEAAAAIAAAGGDGGTACIAAAASCVVDGASLAECVAALGVFKRVEKEGDGGPAASAFKKRCAPLYPLCDAFK